MKIVLFHPSGSAMFVQQTARAYYEANILEKFFLTFAYRPQSLSGKLMRGFLALVSKNPESELKRRAITELPDKMICTHPFFEILRTLSGKYANPALTDFLWEKSEHDFGEFISGKLNTSIDAVHGYEHGSLEVFKKAKQLGIKTIYEMPAPFHKTTTRILEVEYSKFPETISAHKIYTDPLTPKRNKRREEELALSDIVVCNSDFTASSLIEGGVPESKIIKVPYGMPEVQAKELSKPSSKKVVFLYAGTLCVRKGTHYLLEAWRKLNPSLNVELRMFGAVSIKDDLLRNLPGKVTISGTIPKSELYKEYSQAHMLLFPTLCDGFGMVLTEALAKGCPVLTTTNAGASVFIKNYENGFIVPAGDTSAILDKMRWCLDKTEELLEMRENCLQTARSWQWEDYRRSLTEKVKVAI